MKTPNFFVHGTNTFTCDVPLNQIKNHLEKIYTFVINDSTTITTKLDFKKGTDTLLKSIVSYDLPKVELDDNISYGKGCGDSGIWYVFDFDKGIVYIEGDDITGSIGLT